MTLKNKNLNKIKDLKKIDKPEEDKGLSDLQIRLIYVGLNHNKIGIRTQQLEFKLRYRLQRISDKCESVYNSTNKILQDIIKEKFNGKTPNDPESVLKLNKIFDNILLNEYSNIEFEKIPAHLLDSVKMDRNMEVWLNPIIDYSQLEVE